MKMPTSIFFVLAACFHRWLELQIESLLWLAPSKRTLPGSSLVLGQHIAYMSFGWRSSSPTVTRCR
ncbi:hypothetical protein DAI22_05g115800 [Oryza sativa Japonica Group]|nr:hypothetical protein DAI22_05g115800 [Oryza sativa Japonica Group]